MNDLAEAAMPPLTLGRPVGATLRAGPASDARLSPAACVMAVIVAGQGALLVASIVAQRPVVPMSYVVFGYDAIDFWTAARDVLAGLDP